MPLGVSAEITPDLSRWGAAQGRGLRRASQEAVAHATEATKLGAKLEVAGGLGGRRAPNLIGSRYYADTPAGFVFSRWSRRGTAGRPVDILAGFTQDKTLRGRAGQFLVVPFAEAGPRRRALRSGRIRFDRGRVDLVPAGRGFLIVDRGTVRRRGTVLGMLVRQVRQRKRLDFRRVEAEGMRRLTTDLGIELEQELGRA